jgi:transcriptional regulator with XRE-family HTH domain
LKAYPSKDFFNYFEAAGIGVSVRRKKLPAREIEICNRMRAARELLQLTQDGCAHQIGLNRSTLQNYELCRTPVRFEVALRFCRQLIISEEWLATGRFDLAHEKAKALGFTREGENLTGLDEVLFRQCVDLMSEPAALHIPTGTLFSRAYDATLQAHYRDLVFAFFFFPRICLSDADSPKLAVNLLTAINERYIILLSNAALSRNLKPPAAWRPYTRFVFECAHFVFGRMMRPAPALTHGPDYPDWLPYLIANPEARMPFMGEEAQPVQAQQWKSENILLTTSSTSEKLPPVKSQLDNLLATLNRVTKERGKKTALADFLGAPLASVSRWLSGETEPGGETTLRLLEWVQAEEVKPKSPGSATTPPERKTQLRKSTVYEKAKSNPKQR